MYCRVQLCAKHTKSSPNAINPSSCLPISLPSISLSFSSSPLHSFSSPFLSHFSLHLSVHDEVYISSRRSKFWEIMLEGCCRFHQGIIHFGRHHDFGGLNNFKKIGKAPIFFLFFFFSFLYVGEHQINQHYSFRNSDTRKAPLHSSGKWSIYHIAEVCIVLSCYMRWKRRLEPPSTPYLSGKIIF